MTPEEFRDKMRFIANISDPERAHYEADDLICCLLDDLGFGAGIEIYEKMEKWYA